MKTIVRESQGSDAWCRRRRLKCRANRRTEWGVSREDGGELTMCDGVGVERRGVMGQMAMQQGMQLSHL